MPILGKNSLNIGRGGKVGGLEEEEEEEEEEGRVRGGDGA